MNKPDWENAYLRVFVDRHFAGMSDDVRRRELVNVEQQIRRHIDDVRHIEMVVPRACAYCNWPWTETSTEYNGGCCDKDEAGSPVAPVPTHALSDVFPDLDEAARGLMRITSPVKGER